MAMSDTILVTGCAGFIGSAVAARLLAQGRRVVGIDNLNDYYDPGLKRARLASISDHPAFAFVEGDIASTDAVQALFAAHRPARVIHLAAQAGVRYSLVNPQAYAQANLVGFVTMLEACRHNGVEHLVYASTSSVYGASRAMPFSPRQVTDQPLTLYAATKKANELMAHSYSHLFALPTTGLRFFTVYGPWDRPDMAMQIFARAIVSGQPIPLFNRGEMRRDFTFIDDIVEGVVRVCDHTAAPDASWNPENPVPGSSRAPFRVYNIGRNAPERLAHVVALLEHHFGREARKELLPMQPGDVPETFADVSDLEAATGFAPTVSIEEGVERFVAWYRHYHRV